MMRRLVPVLFFLTCAFTAPACASEVASAPPPPPPCEQICKDAIALRGMREQMKQVFNFTLQGKPVGQHDESIACPLGGKARVFGVATANPTFGATEVSLTYVFEGCTLVSRDNDPKQNYRLALSGTITQKGTLAIQPTSTTALAIEAKGLSLQGTIYDPAEPYEAVACEALLSQNGNKLSGVYCGRDAMVDL